MAVLDFDFVECSRGFVVCETNSPKELCGWKDAGLDAIGRFRSVMQFTLIGSGHPAGRASGECAC